MLAKKWVRIASARLVASFGASCTIRGLENGSRQQYLRIGSQGLTKPFWGSGFEHCSLCGCGENLGVTHMQPVCRFIDGPPEMPRIHKGSSNTTGWPKYLANHQGVFLAQRQNARTQIGNVPLGEDQKTAVVDHQLQAIISDGANSSRSSDPVPHTSRLQRKSSEVPPIGHATGQCTKAFRDLG